MDHRPQIGKNEALLRGVKRGSPLSLERRSSALARRLGGRPEVADAPLSTGSTRNPPPSFPASGGFCFLAASTSGLEEPGFTRCRG